MYDLHCFNLFLICFKSLPVSPFCRTSILVSLIPLVYAIYGGRNMVKHHIRANVFVTCYFTVHKAYIQP